MILFLAALVSVATGAPRKAMTVSGPISWHTFFWSTRRPKDLKSDIASSRNLSGSVLVSKVIEPLTVHLGSLALMMLNASGLSNSRSCFLITNWNLVKYSSVILGDVTVGAPPLGIMAALDFPSCAHSLVKASFPLFCCQRISWFHMLLFVWGTFTADFTMKLCFHIFFAC